MTPEKSYHYYINYEMVSLCHFKTISNYINQNISCVIVIITMKAISTAQKDNILSLSYAGLSARQISSRTGVCKSTVAKFIKESHPDKENSCGGRPSKLISTDKRAIIQHITTGKADNAVQVTHYINSTITTTVSSQTVRNVLKAAHLKAVTKKKKPLLTIQHRQRRLAFALAHQNWTIEDWKRVIWSDETKINRIGSDGKVYVWKKKGDGLIDREVSGTIKFGGGSLMVWGCMGWNGVGMLAEVVGKMNAKQYVDILNDHLWHSIVESGIDEEDIIFQQDNDPKHTSRRAREWFEEHNINVLDWPAQSPDINAIEHLWGTLKKKLQTYETPPKGVWELWERVVVEWGKITAEDCQKLIESMPRRIEAVIKAKGGHTKY